MHSLLQDLRLGARTLRKTPGATAIAIAALTMGIGLSVLMFSIIQGAILRGLPFDEPRQLMYLNSANLEAGQEDLNVRIHDFADWRARQRSFEDIAAFYTGTVNVSGGDRPERFDGAFITPAAFPLLRVQPRIGRLFTDDDARPGAATVILLSHDVWRDRFHSDPGVVGSTLRANGRETTVIGVMPEGFRFPIVQQVWMPLHADPLSTPRAEGRFVAAFGRLRDGVDAETATRDLNAIAAQLATEHPETNEGISAFVQPYIREFIDAEPTAMLYTMLGAVLLVLLMGCANVANLLMSRTAVRLKEIGIRCALGAGRTRIVVQFLAEAFLLALAGAALGLVVAQIGIRLFNAAIAPTDPPFWIDIRIDGAALLFVLALTVVATLAAGTLPAFQAANANINDILKDEARGSSGLKIGRISRGLVVLDIALSCGLLVGAGLMTRSVLKLQSLDIGFPTDDVFVARVGLPEADYAAPADQVRFFEGLLPRLAAIPGVASAALVDGLPGLGSGSTTLAIDGFTYDDPTDMPSARLATITPGFFETVGLGVLEGRAFTAHDIAGGLRVAIVNRSFAQRHWPGGSAVGHRIRLGDEGTAEWATIVGVAPDLYMSGVQNEQPEGVYIPFAQSPGRFMSIMARTRGSPLALTAAFRDAVAAADPDLPLYWVDSLRHSIAADNWHYRVFGGLFMVFGLVALLLAAVGLYGVMAFSVGQRTREMGVRMALGARAADVISLIMRQGLVQLGFGLLFGLALAWALSNLLTTLLFDVSPRDPLTFLAIVLVLTATTALACFVPARRATAVHPSAALRCE